MNTTLDLWDADPRVRLPPLAGAITVVSAMVVALLVPTSAVFAIGAAAVVAVALSPALGLAILVFLTWSRLSDALISSVGAPSIAQPYVIFLGLVVVGRWFLLGEEPVRWRTPAMFLYAYALMAVGSLFYADGFDAALLETIEFGKAALIYALALSLMSTPDRLRVAMWSLLAVGGLLGLATVVQYVTGDFENTFYGLARAEVQQIVGELDDHRASGPGIGPNGFAQIMLVIVPIAIERARRDPWKWARPFAGAVALLTIAAVVLTFSRQALIAAVVMAAAAAALARLDLTKVAAAALAVMALIVVLAPEGYLERLSTLADLAPTSDTPITAEGSYRGRLSEYIVGVQMFGDNPLLGEGIGNYNHHYQEYARPLGLESRRVGRSPHSLYLEFASELGIVGLAWFAALNVFAFRGLARAKAVAFERGQPSLASLTTALQVSLIGYLTTSVLRHMAFPRYFWLLYAIVLSVPLVVDRLASSRPVETT